MTNLQETPAWLSESPTVARQPRAAAAIRLAAGADGKNGTPGPVLSVKTNDKGQVFSHIRQKWLIETPEERVRQAYVVTLHNEYGFDLNQMDEELHVAGRGFGTGAGRRRYLAARPKTRPIARPR